MISGLSSRSRRPRLRFFHYSCLCGGAVLLSLISGCGGGSSATSNMTGNTTVVVLASSTANDQVSRISLQLSGLTLTTKDGETVTVFSTPQNVEFTHLNGTPEPLVVASVPQGTYTAASVVAATGNNNATCVAQNTAAKETDFNSAINFSTGATVNLPAPITVTGTTMALVLDLQVAKASPFDCTYLAGSNSMTAAFNLTPMKLAALPTNSTNGKATGLRGVINTVTGNGASLGVTATDGPSWQISTGASTVYQGITGASQLASGLPVDVDVTIQQDGSLLATRIAAFDTSTNALSILSGPLVEVNSSVPAILTLNVESQGSLFAGFAPGPFNFNFSKTVFQTSGQLTNIQSLPFTAAFSASNMVPGQNVFFTTHATTIVGGPTYIPATTMTLLPQSIDGIVSAVSTSGNFTTYTVKLAPYNVFPDFAVQPGEANLLTDPSTVVVYVDSNTQLLDSGSIAAGSVLRFNGLIFNDNGVLRMDCAQVSDGVPQ